MVTYSSLASQGLRSTSRPLRCGSQLLVIKDGNSVTKWFSEYMWPVICFFFCFRWTIIYKTNTYFIISRCIHAHIGAYPLHLLPRQYNVDSPPIKKFRLLHENLAIELLFSILTNPRRGAGGAGQPCANNYKYFIHISVQEKNVRGCRVVSTFQVLMHIKYQSCHWMVNIGTCFNILENNIMWQLSIHEQPYFLTFLHVGVVVLVIVW